jgi:hypothetical protein
MNNNDIETIKVALTSSDPSESLCSTKPTNVAAPPAALPNLLKIFLSAFSCLFLNSSAEAVEYFQ